MSKPVVVCSADMEHLAEARAILESAFEVRYIEPTAEAMLAHLPEAAGYFASLYVRITAEMMRRAPRLRAIATASTGRDHIDLDEAARRSIAVLSLKDDREFLDRITATAELTWALLLATVRRIPAAVRAAQQGRWARDEFRGHQIAYKTLGILGCGRLGTMVAGYGRAFRMQVIGCDVQPVQLEGVEMVSYDQLLRRSDILSIHIHLTEENRGFVDRASLARMKPTAVLINTSRGAIVDEEALVEALSSGQLAAAAVDVIEGEWQQDLREHPMIVYAREHENLVITPHIGGVTYESQALAFAAAAQKLKDFFTGSPSIIL